LKRHLYLNAPKDESEAQKTKQPFGIETSFYDHRSRIYT